ncbi:MAG: hypothetical protein PHU23_07010 [Dehalococcoidales bacterium]|nr:hypothetical protein [Dehalococcoidales bacterium]
MVEGKWDNYFIKEPVVDGRFAPRLKFFAGDYFGEKNCSILWNCIKEPFTMVEEAHAHDFDQYLSFFGGDSSNIKDFGALIDFTIDGEKHTITSTTVVHIPAGVMHCPLRFVRVDKPVIFMNVAMTPQYIKPGSAPHK